MAWVRGGETSGRGAESARRIAADGLGEPGLRRERETSADGSTAGQTFRRAFDLRLLPLAPPLVCRKISRALNHHTLLRPPPGDNAFSITVVYFT